MSQTDTAQFGKLRSFLWPVHNFELKKLVPMVLMFFLILFNYTILRDLKDSLIVTAAGSGAETIPFLKVWGVLPMAFLFMVVYAKLSNKLSKKNLFYSTIVPFLVFFSLFATVIYPLRDYLHPHELADKLQASYPNLNGLIAVFRNWSFSLFYVMAELWGSVALSLLFWGFANDITKVSESKRFYNLFGLFGNFALILSGQTIVFFSRYSKKVAAAGGDSMQVTLNYLMSAVIVSALLIIGLYWWMQKYVLTDKRFYNPEECKKAKKSKPKMSMKESFLYLIRSKYIGCLAVLVLAYGICINLIEVTWKSQLKLQYSNPTDYAEFMGNFSTFTGIAVILMMLFVGGNVIRKFGWTKGALATPIVLMLTGAVFFSFIMFGDSLTGITSILSTTPLMIAVMFGTIQNIMSKSTKYSLFDPTKEMAYIPLDQESKVKGKAAIDVVGARLGKAGGSLIQQFLIVSFGIAGMTPYVGGILLFILLAWMVAAKSLGKQFGALTAKRDAERAAETKVEELVEVAASSTETPAATPQKDATT